MAAYGGLLRVTRWNRARMRLEWENLPHPQGVAPTTGASLVQPDHPYAGDLDIVGERSLLALLDTCATEEGAAWLATMLLHAAPDAAALAERQVLIRELIPLTTFRSRLAAFRGADGERYRANDLLRWLDNAGEQSNPPIMGFDPILLIVSVLAVVNAVLFALWAQGVLPPLFALSFMLYVGLSLTRARDVMGLFGEVNAALRLLNAAKAAFEHLESFGYSRTSHLRDLCAPFLAADRPSAQIRRLARIAAAAGLQGNTILWALVNAVMPWDLAWALAMRRAKSALALRMPEWIAAWTTTEALCALATFAYLNPDYTFPKIEQSPSGQGGEIFAARALGHPLIAHERRVRNDFAFKQLGDVALITGSNMSGKSSFLRTLGINLVLAYAGAPVCAESMQTGVFRLFTCIQVQDSLADGFSYFYAEVRRLKALLDALEKPDPAPLFFLIDEIFRGTNNRERLIGSRAYVRALTGKHGVGAISTHDLELVQLADELPTITNYHFADAVRDGSMVFDYMLRRGASPTTNALKIMRLAGLPVENNP
jgi:DNA mismatch repair ATPase MutS